MIPHLPTALPYPLVLRTDCKSGVYLLIGSQMLKPTQTRELVPHFSEYTPVSALYLAMGCAHGTRDMQLYLLLDIVLEFGCLSIPL